MNAHVSPTPALINPLATSAMLARFSITQCTFRKVDKRATDTVNAGANAKADAGRYHKALIAAEALGKITSAVSTARTFHADHTLPWLDDGARILPAAAYQRYSDGMHRHRVDFEAAVEAFIAAYPEFVASAAGRLGDLFDASEYPAISHIRERFTFGVRILPMPDAGDFRVNISEATAQAIRSDIEASTREALESAMSDAWRRIVEQVGRMAEKLAAFKPAQGAAKAENVFRNSLVENVRELVEVLPAFNLTADPFLARTIQRMRDELCAVDADRLRESATARAEVSASAADILADVSAYLA